MADTPRIGYGGQVSYDNDGAGTGAVTLTKLAKVKPPEVSIAKADASHLESPANHKEYLPGDAGLWRDTDEVDCSILLTEAQHNSVYTLFTAGTEKYWYIKLPKTTGQVTASQLKGRGYISKCKITELDRGSDAPLMVDFSVQRTTDKFTFSLGS